MGIIISQYNMSEVSSRIPFDRSSGKYKGEWQASQDEQNAYDDRIRRGVNAQVSDYVQDGELICFGVSEHTLEERQFEWTPKAKHDLAVLQSWFPKDDLTMITRPAYKSDFDWTSYASRAQVCNFIIRGVGRGLRYNRPLVMYNHTFNNKALINYPDLFYWTVTRILPKNPPVPDAHREWRTR